MKIATKLCLLLLSIKSVFGETTPVVKAPLTSVDRRQLKENARLEAAYQEVMTDYAPILSAFNKLKAAPPAEYAFHLSNLKGAVITATEENKLGLYKSVVKRTISTGLFGSPASNPLIKFQENIVPAAINSLAYQQRYVKESPLRKKIDQLVSDLKEIKRIFT